MDTQGVSVESSCSAASRRRKQGGIEFTWLKSSEILLGTQLYGYIADGICTYIHSEKNAQVVRLYAVLRSPFESVGLRPSPFILLRQQCVMQPCYCPSRKIRRKNKGIRDCLPTERKICQSAYLRTVCAGPA